MNDLADRADSECEHELAEALRQRKPGGPAPTGWCHYCREPLAPGWRWCGHGCEDAWSVTGESKMHRTVEAMQGLNYSTVHTRITRLGWTAKDALRIKGDGRRQQNARDWR